MRVQPARNELEHREAVGARGASRTPLSDLAGLAPALVFLVALTGCGQAPPQGPPPQSPPPAPGQGPAAEPPAPAQPPATAQTRPAASPEPPAAPGSTAPGSTLPERKLAPRAEALPAPAFSPEEATGTSRIGIDISAPFAAAGIQLQLSFDGERFLAAPPETSEQLQGFLCADNPGIKGRFLYACATASSRPLSGRLVVLPLHHRGPPPRLDEIRIDKATLIDERVQEAPEGVRVVLSLLP